MRDIRIRLIVEKKYRPTPNKDQIAKQKYFEERLHNGNGH